MKKFNQILIVIAYLNSVYGQLLNPVKKRIHSNEIAASMYLDGNMFTDNLDRGFVVPFENPRSPSSIYSTSLLFAGKDLDSNILLAVKSNLNTYISGPLFNENYIPTTEQIQSFNKIWSVNRDDILAHIKDFKDNGRIDLKLTDIYSWPGRSNPYFQKYNQFLPFQIDYDLAPFFDNNKDGIYNPDNGDFPIVPSVDKSVIPASLHWGIFHKINGKLRLEVGLTCWEMECDDNPVLNRSFFCSYKLSNKCSFEIKESIVSINFDPDLGCYSDDFIGSIPTKNASYSYNAVAIDGNSSNQCDRGVYSYTGNPPVQSLVFLNRKMDVFITSYKRTNPSNSFEFYDYLNAKYGNMDILINPKTNLPTKFEFSDNPLDPNGWSMYALNIGEVDVRAYNTSLLGNILPNESKSLDVAYVFHHHPDSSFLQNVNLSYQQIDKVQELYNKAFVSSCNYQTCSYDCVWPGDTDLDGIVDYLDVVNIFKANNSTGNTRTESWVWKAHEALNWNKVNSSGINYKHYDLNGDGIINKSDLDILIHNSGKTHGNFSQKPETCTEGKDFFWQIVKDTFLNSSLFINLVYLSSGKKYQGLSYEIKVDSDCAHISQTIYNKIWKDSLVNILFYTENDPSLSKLDRKKFVYFTSTGRNEIGLDSIILRTLLSKSLIPTNKTFFDLEVCNAKLYFEDGSVMPLGTRKQRIYISPNSVNNTESKEAPIIFPNPADESVFISNGEDIQSAQLFSIQGVLIDKYKFTFQNKSIDISALENGTYILVLKGIYKNHYKKLVIHH